MKQSNLPAYIDAELWQDFVAHRKEIRHKLTPTTTKFIMKKLAGFNARGVDVNKAIRQTLENGWQGIFEVKDGNQKANGISTPQSRGREATERYLAESGGEVLETNA